MRILVLILFTNWMFGQQLHHHMLSAQGKSATTNKGIKVTQTIAQQSSIGTSSKVKVIVSRGFQQSKISNVQPIVNDAITTLVYPNPIEDIVNFKFSSPVNGKIAVSIYDIHGRLIVFQEKEAENNLLTINNLLLAAGEYFVKLDGERYSFSTTILKSK
jgi:Secretion system C-terminal sorting domain